MVKVSAADAALTAATAMPAANRTDFIVASLTRREPVLRLAGLSLGVVSSGILLFGSRPSDGTIPWAILPEAHDVTGYIDRQ